MAEEIVDIFDENYRHLGTATKAEARKKGDWIQSIHAWIVNPRDSGYVLFQKRGQHKKIYPNALDISAAGHYKAGEKIEDGVREISEELGLSVNFTNLIPLGVKLDIGKAGENIIHEFCHTFLLKSELEPKEYEFVDGEVEGLVKISIEDGLALFSGKTNEVMAHGIEWIPETKKYVPVDLLVNKDLFIPRIDPYYYKIFIMAKLFLGRETCLAI
ncbi:putative Nudix hydrolase [Planctomycetales bacterium]|nr:putative Nudix hydrolase [Planctomycetales bacterium]